MLTAAKFIEQSVAEYRPVIRPTNGLKVLAAAHPALNRTGEGSSPSESIVEFNGIRRSIFDNPKSAIGAVAQWQSTALVKRQREFDSHPRPGNASALHPCCCSGSPKVVSSLRRHGRLGSVCFTLFRNIVILRNNVTQAIVERLTRRFDFPTSIDPHPAIRIKRRAFAAVVQW